MQMTSSCISQIRRSWFSRSKKFFKHSNRSSLRLSWTFLLTKGEMEGKSKPEVSDGYFKKELEDYCREVEEHWVSRDGWENQHVRRMVKKEQPRRANLKPGKWDNEMFIGCERQIFEAAIRNKVRGLAGQFTVNCKIKVLSETFSWSRRSRQIADAYMFKRRQTYCAQLRSGSKDRQ